MDRPSPVPCPMGVVVKKGSKIRSITSGAMPVPLSLTQEEIWLPGVRPLSRPLGMSRQLFAVSIGSRPLSGIASRALMARLSKVLSSCTASTLIGQSPCAASISTMIARPDRPSDQFLHSEEEAVQIFGLGIEGLAPRKSEKPLGEGRSALRRRLRAGQKAIQAIGTSLVQPSLDDFEAAADPGEQIVEVMRNAARELADRLHLLRLAESLMGLGQLGRPRGQQRYPVPNSRQPASGTFSRCRISTKRLRKCSMSVRFLARIVNSVALRPCARHNLSAPAVLVIEQGGLRVSRHR
jgi:hypothetical protein